MEFKNYVLTTLTHLFIFEWYVPECILFKCWYLFSTFWFENGNELKCTYDISTIGYYLVRKCG